LRTNSAPCASAERRGRGHELLVAELLVAQLHDVDAPAQRRVEERVQLAAAAARAADEVQAAGGDAVARRHLRSSQARRAY
jgi:hypothetical protein